MIDDVPYRAIEAEMSRVAAVALADATPPRGSGLAFRVAAMAASRSAWYAPDLHPERLEIGALLTYVDGLMERMGDVLRGEGRSVIRDIGPDTWRAYNEGPVVQRLVQRVAERVAQVAPDAPRILEVGGGTAATTRAVLARGVPAERYVFSDVSARFLNDAAEGRSTPVPMQVVYLDLRAPFLLGESYDVIVGMNALHVSPAPATVAWLAGLLRPGGCLILGEGGAPYIEPNQPWPLDMLFQCFPGWTGFLSRARWEALLAPYFEVSTEEWCSDGRLFGSVMVGRRT